MLCQAHEAHVRVPRMAVPYSALYSLAPGIFK